MSVLNVVRVVQMGGGAPDRIMRVWRRPTSYGTSRARELGWRLCMCPCTGLCLCLCSRLRAYADSLTKPEDERFSRSVSPQYHGLDLAPRQFGSPRRHRLKRPVDVLPWPALPALPGCRPRISRDLGSVRLFGG